MRQPLEDGTVCIARAAMSLTFPPRFMLGRGYESVSPAGFTTTVPRMPAARRP